MKREGALRMIGGLTAVAVLGGGAFAGIVELLKQRALFYPDVYPAGVWDFSRLPVAPEDRFFETEDGVRLHGLLLRGSPGRPLLLWFHGNGGNLSNRAPVAAEFARRGTSVFLFDYRGYGRSAGSPTEKGLLRDSEAAYEYATHELGYAPRDIALYGESLGGAYAAWIASRNGARCVVVENSFPSLAAMAKLAYPMLPTELLLSRSLTTVRWLNEADLPVLVLHGTADDVIPYALGRRLYDELRTKKAFYRAEGAVHGSIPFVEGAEYYARVLHFIDDPASAA